MPTLEWMGKNKVVAYHRQVPYRVLEHVPEKASWILMAPTAATWSSMGTILKRSRPCCPNTKGT